MYDSLYTYSLFVLAITLFVLGLLLLFLEAPANLKSGAYRNAQRAIVFALLFFGAVNLFEYLERFRSGKSESILFLTIATLIIASVQAFLFTYSMLSLINKQTRKCKQIMFEIVAIALFIMLGVIVFLHANKIVTLVFVYVYTAFYFSQLIRYTLIFTRQYNHSVREMDNYFSGQEAKRMRWIRVSFFLALAIGIMALVFALFPSSLFGFTCTVVCLLFYLYFPIRFINYAFVFQNIEDILENENKSEDIIQCNTTDSTPQINSKLLQKWLKNKRFTQAGITIKDMAAEMGTNTKYLSVYINQNKNLTFSQWINSLRIEESKRLLTDNPQQLIDDVANTVGYSDRSHFIKQFTAIVGTSPRKWCKELK